MILQSLNFCRLQQTYTTPQTPPPLGAAADGHQGQGRPVRTQCTQGSYRVQGSLRAHVRWELGCGEPWWSREARGRRAY